MKGLLRRRLALPKVITGVTRQLASGTLPCYCGKFAAKSFFTVVESAMKTPLPNFPAILSTLLLASCSGGISGSGSVPMATPPPIITKTYSFAAGNASAIAGTPWNIIGVRTTLTGRFANGGGNTYDTLTVDVTFAQDISNALPLPGTPLSKGNQLGIALGIDSDNNVSTGNYLSCDSTNRNVTPLEYIVDQGNDPARLPDGNYSIIGPSGGPISSGPNADPASEAVVSLSGNILTESIFLPAIGASVGAAIPKFGIAIAAYNGASKTYTDCVPLDGRIVLPVS